MQNILEVRDLTFSYENRLSGGSVLEGVSFSVGKGDFVGLIGSNGAGKSTLLKILLGLLTPDGGSVAFSESRAKVGYVEQNASRRSGFPATAQELVLAGLYAQIGLMRFPKKEHRAKALEALKTVGMEAYAGRLISEMSGGQQQRVMIARVLAGNPSVLILDEPTTGVDDKSCDALYELLQKLNRERKLTILIVSHDLRKLSKCAGRLLILEDGAVREIAEGERFRL